MKKEMTCGHVLLIALSFSLTMLQLICVARTEFIGRWNSFFLMYVGRVGIDKRCLRRYSLV